MILLLLATHIMGTVLMETAREEPLFSPNLYQTGAGCAWRFSIPPQLSLNEWFIAGPPPGVHRAEWLQDAISYRSQVREGRGRVLHMNGGKGAAWIRPSPSLVKALDLSGGEELHLSFRVRNISGNNVLAVAADYYDAAPETWQGSSDVLAALTISDDGEWHEHELSVVVPATDNVDAWPGPLVSLAGVKEQAAGCIELSAMILRVDDEERMDALDRVMLELDKHHIDGGIYEREDLAWTASTHACHFMFMYDQRFYTVEEGYRVEAFLDDLNRRFGGIDAVILWAAYPRIGVDDRNQFDFFRDMPGGLAGLREVSQQFKERGVRVLIPWLPWDEGTRREGVSDDEALAELVLQLDVDGIFLDTLTGAAQNLRVVMDETRNGVALAPELCPPIEQLDWCNMSWAQWAHDPNPPGIPLLKWIEPRHMQHFTRRWDTCHANDIETAFFNGSGLLLWENIFGTHNPYTPEDALLWSRCISILRTFNKLFTSSLWDPFYSVLQEDVFAHRWPGSPTTLFTLRNLGAPIEHGLLLRWQLPHHVRQHTMQVWDLWHGRRAAWDISEFGVVQVWGDIDRLGCIAVTFGEDDRIEGLLEHQLALRNRNKPHAAPESRSSVSPVAPVRTALADAAAPPKGMVYVPGGVVRMRLEHQRRECGCYPDPGTPPEGHDYFLRGHPHDETLVHDYEVETPPFYISETQITNREFRRFIEASGYQPAHTKNFLKHWPGGIMPEAIAELPVVYVDLDDARAYANWAGKRLPTEPEWQRAAQGDDGRRWPWGDAFDPARCAPAGDGPVAARSLPEGRSPYGCYHMSGNVWEWTESERNDGITRFCIIRGGSYYRADGSGWYADGGPQPLDTHTKFLMLWPGLDRCANIGFRCVKDIVDNARTSDL